MKKLSGIAGLLGLLFFVLTVPAAHAQSFTFGAAGDFTQGSNFQATANAAGTNNLNFFVTLGDNSYSAGAEQAWCGTLSSKVPQIALIAGNHDTGESSGGNIDVYRQHCKYSASPVNGDFGKQYYFDYPATNPIARFIMISPGVKGSVNISYANGGAGYTFTSNAIDDARAKGIKWIIVGMHKNYISAMEKSNELGADLIPMLLSKKVDVILQGHEHGYERTKQLSCAKAGSYDATCVVDTDASMVKGAGSVIAVLGTGGASLRGINTGDTEYQYFAASDVTTYGFGKFTVSPTAIQYNFVKAAGGSFTDTFTITDSGQQTAPSGYANPTFGVIAPCPSCIEPTTPNISDRPLPSPWYVAPSGVSISPVEPVDPCAAGTSLADHRKRKHWNHDGGISRAVELILEFFLKLIELLLRLLGGGNINVPQQPSPEVPESTPVPDPETPVPCPSAEVQEPTSGMPQPSSPAQPQPSTAVPSQAAPVSVVPSQPGGGNEPTATTCGGTANTPNAPVTGYRLTKCEDFNGTSIPTGWTAYDGGGGDTVVGVGRKPEQCTVGAGVLTQTQNADGATCGMSSDFGQKYGYWEVKMRAFTTGGSGSAPHPVLILWPDTDVWADGELDYFESDIGDPEMGVFLHCVGNPSSNCFTHTQAVDFSQWHVYGFEWTAAGFKGFVDGKEIYSTDGKGSNPSVAMHQTIQLDNLTKQTPAKPAKMEVDWVHMYSK